MRCTCERATPETLRITRLDPQCRVHRELYERLRSSTDSEDDR